MIYVYGDEEYAALRFEQFFVGTSIRDIIDQNLQMPDGIEISLYEFGDIDPSFIEFLRFEQDYEASYKRNFYFENQTL